jgi:hypothetical protein
VKYKILYNITNSFYSDCEVKYQVSDHNEFVTNSSEEIVSQRQRDLINSESSKSSLKFDQIQWINFMKFLNIWSGNNISEKTDLNSFAT